MRAKTWLVLLVVIVCLALAARAQAAASPGYHIDWLNVAAGAAGSAGSAHYAADLSVGQSVLGEGANSSYRGMWGFWVVVDALWRVLVPLVTRSALHNPAPQLR